MWHFHFKEKKKHHTKFLLQTYLDLGIYFFLVGLGVFSDCQTHNKMQIIDLQNVESVKKNFLTAHGSEELARANGSVWTTFCSCDALLCSLPWPR